MRALYKQLICLALSLSFTASAVAAEDIAVGRPTQLPATSYVEVETRQPKNASVVWVNFKKLRELGYDTSHGLTPELKATLLRSFARVVVPKGADLSRYSNTIKILYADKYGSVGINGNLGSGRAASAGKYQLKGMPTPLIGPGADEIHSTGILWLWEGITESVWPTVLEKELPYGANEAIALIGLEETSTEGPRTVMVRNDPMRPAQFLSNGDAAKLNPEAEAARVKNAVESLPLAWNKALGLPHGAPLKETVKEFTERLADQYAYSFANRLFHGATTPSNIMMSGGFLDFGTQTSLPGYHAVRSSDVLPNGDIQVVQKYLLEPTLEDLRKNMSPEDAKALPSSASVEKILTRRYEESLRKEMLKLTGVPGPVADSLASTPAGKDFFRAMQAIYAHDRDVVVKKMKLYPERVNSHYELNTMLSEAGQHPFATSAEMQASLAKYLPPEELASFVAAYEKFMKQAEISAAAQGISRDFLQKFMAPQSRSLNLFRDGLFVSKENERKVVEMAIAIGEGKVDSQNLIDRMQLDNTRFDRYVPAYSAVLGRSDNPVAGETVISLFDAKDGQEKTMFRFHAPEVNGVAQLQGEKFPAAFPSELRYRTHEGEEKAVVGYRQGAELSFVVPDQLDISSVKVIVGDSPITPAFAHVPKIRGNCGSQFSSLRAH